MALTEQDWVLAQKKGSKASRRPAVDPRLVEQATVHASLLVGTAEWDWFLTRLQTLVEHAASERDAWQEKYLGAFDEPSRNLAQVNYHRAFATVETLKVVIALPSKYKEVAHGHQPRLD